MNSYNQTIQLNNTNLQVILNKINGLPEDDLILQDKTITPTQNQQTITFDTEYDGLNTVTVEGDNNLVAENIKSGVNIFGINGTLEIAGNTENEDGLISGDSTIYTNERVSKVADYKFYSHSYLTSVNLPNVISVGASAFESCHNLISVNLPNVISVGASAFANCSNLTSINFPNAATINNRAFANCSNLTSVDLPNVTIFDIFVLWNCPKLSIINLPGAITISASAFGYCSNLASINLPNAITIGSSAFVNCSNLSKIYLGASQVCKLSNSNAFYKAGIGSNKGSIFVPASLVSSYKAATNWTYYSNRIFSAQ